jgi:hypothetical protein
MLIVRSLQERMVFFMNPIVSSELTLFAKELQRFLSPKKQGFQEGIWKTKPKIRSIMLGFI